MNIKELPFKEMAKTFNEALKDVKIEESFSPGYIRYLVLQKLIEKCPQFPIKMIGHHDKKFQMTFHYKNDYKGIKEYDAGWIDLIFSVRTQKTDKVDELYRGKRVRYIHARHNKPITFSKYTIHSCVSSFNWASNDQTNLRIKPDGHYLGDTSCFVSGNTIKELIKNIPETYDYKFEKHVVQPFLKQLSFPNERKNAINEKIPEHIKKAIEQKDNETFFKEMKNFIMDQKLITN